MQYRREIDGLRALAVIPVILFHTGWHQFSGGFVGVDVFFIISGFLITSIIVTEHRKDTFSIVSFYERRARRIVPALFVMMLACLPIAWLWLLPVDMKDFSKSLTAVPGFVSNVIFYLSSGYFESETAAKPLLHTWSLAVEEQYYLLFPVLLTIVYRWGSRRAFAVVAAAAFASFAWSQWSLKSNPGMAFFMPHTRAWELLLGSLAAIFVAERAGRGEIVRGPTREVLAIAGVLLILYAIVRFDGRTPFPGMYALVPTVGTLLIVLLADETTFVGRILGTRLLVGVGLISYSAYLWHQPLFAFARQRFLGPPNKVLLGLLILASMALAFLSWKYVELPFRDRQKFNRSQVFSLVGIGSLVFVLFGLCGQMTNGFSERLPFIAALETVKTVETSPCHTTQRRTAEQLAAGNFCTVGPSGDIPTFAVVGDSHAGALFEGIAATIPHRAFVAVSGGWCAPMLNGFDSGGPTCLATTKAALERIAATPTIRDVVLSAEWALYTSGYRDGGSAAVYSDNQGKASSTAENVKVFARSLNASIELLKGAGKHIIIVGPVPEFSEPVIKTISKSLQFAGTGNNVADVVAFAPHIADASYRARNTEVFAVFKGLSGVDLIDSSQLFCADAVCRSATPRGEVLFSDTNHVTEYGASMVAREIQKRLTL